MVTLRNRARDLRRNNSYAQKIVQSLSANVIGTGIIAASTDSNFLKIFNDWADSSSVDANGKTNFYGIQDLAFETLVESRRSVDSQTIR